VQGVACIPIAQLMYDAHGGKAEKREQHEPVAGRHSRESPVVIGEDLSILSNQRRPIFKSWYCIS
jgi:hypothetical protein